MLSHKTAIKNARILIAQKHPYISEAIAAAGANAELEKVLKKIVKIPIDLSNQSGEKIEVVLGEDLSRRGVTIHALKVLNAEQESQPQEEALPMPVTEEALPVDKKRGAK